MSRTLLAADVERYLLETMARDTEVERALREETATLPMARMQIGRDQACLFTLLVRAIGARRAVEVGTFTGMSALAVARGLPEDGLLVACDVNREWTDIARRHWQAAGVAARIDLRLAPAEDTLRALVEREPGSFDFAFIDADKESYPRYYELCLALLRKGGLLALDNMLWSGRVTANPSLMDEETRTLHQLNARIRDDARVDAVLLSVGDGIQLVRKR
ncbi:MAG: class I SAM-dependent methyltransferase [Deltaproteobacteria bacterium]|nr:class I SAM-dependent methyltransferase [Deltaproteobacteria bacterium]